MHFHAGLGLLALANKQGPQSQEIFMCKHITLVYHWLKLCTFHLSHRFNYTQFNAAHWAFLYFPWLCRNRRWTRGVLHGPKKRSTGQPCSSGNMSPCGIGLPKLMQIDVDTAYSYSSQSADNRWTCHRSRLSLLRSRWLSMAPVLSLLHSPRNQLTGIHMSDLLPQLTSLVSSCCSTFSGLLPNLKIPSLLLRRKQRRQSNSRRLKVLIVQQKGQGAGDHLPMAR